MTQEEKRKLKYPDTQWFRYHNVNPKNKITTDCVYRAISNAMVLPYEQVAREMTELQIKTGWDTAEKRLIDKYILSKGWYRHPQPKKPDNSKYTGKEFVEYMLNLNKHKFNAGNIIMNIGSEHLSCVIDGKIEDIWNCSNNCVGTWWSK